MSFEAMALAVDVQSLKSTQKFVLLMLCNRIDKDTWTCFPKVKTIAADCCLSESAVKQALKDLAEIGLIEIVPRFHEGIQLSNEYRLTSKIREMSQPSGLFPARPPVAKKPQVGRQVTTEPVIEPVIEPIPPKPPKGEGQAKGFSEFWEAWPKSSRKASKSKCEAHWIQKALSSKADSILAHVEVMKKSDDWKRQNGQYIPAPIVYLRGERWDGAEIEARTEATKPCQKKWAGVI